ncbi:hypothetical protein JCM3765_005277 [Sporobolomyces pararoseus]
MEIGVKEFPLPIQSTSTPSTSSSSEGQTEDLTRGLQRPSIEIFRTLDPEPREPYVSLGRIFLACGLTQVEGLLKFKLERPDYDCTLGGIAPFYDIWVPLRDARDIAKELGVINQLAGLLEWETRKAYSVEDKEEGGITHNWKIASDRIAPQDYSTQQMLSVSFPRIHLLPPNSQVRTLLPPISTFKAYSSSPTLTTPSSTSAATSYDPLWIKLTEWSINEYENWLELDSESSTDSTSSSLASSSPSSSSSPNEQIDPDPEPSLTPLFLFSTLFPLLSLTGQLPSTSTSNPNQLSHLQDVLLSRLELLPSSSTAVASTSTSSRRRTSLSTKSLRKGNLYLVDAVTRLVLDAYRRTSNESFTEEKLATTGAQRDDEKRKLADRKKEKEEGWKKAFDDRISVLEADRQDVLSSLGQVGEGSSSLRNEFEELRERIRKLEARENRVKGAAAFSGGSEVGRDSDSLPDSLGIPQAQELVSGRDEGKWIIDSRERASSSPMGAIGDWLITLGVQSMLVLVIAVLYLK